jgi:heterotetrameric sarcosine oxidase delta subunit
MRIPCPYCGPRSHDEFVYYGDATLHRPEASGSGAEAAFCDYVYVRDNPAGPHRELWFHAASCHEWLVVTRDTRTHAISGAEPARKGHSTSVGEPR